MKKNIYYLSFLFLMYCCLTSSFGQTTYTFTGAGADGSGNNSQHKTITTNPVGLNIEISDNMGYSSGVFFPDATGTGEVIYTIKGDGVSLGSFDVTDMVWGNFTGSSTLNELPTKIVFTKTDTSTETWTALTPTYQGLLSYTTADHSILNIFTEASTVTNVSQIEITVDFQGGGNINNYELRSITLDNLSAPTLGIDNNLLNNSIRIFPNPVKNELYFTLDNNIKLANLKIYDFSGKLLNVCSSSNNKVDISNLDNGIYAIKIDTNKGTVTKLIVKD